LFASSGPDSNGCTKDPSRITQNPAVITTGLELWSL
jgi:hypothetical protein